MDHSLCAKSQDGNEIFFKCKLTTPLQKLMTVRALSRLLRDSLSLSLAALLTLARALSLQAFCNRNGVAMNSVRFLFDGNRVNPTQTPQDLDMEDGDVIDVMVEQQGGGAVAAAVAAAACDA